MAGIPAHTRIMVGVSGGADSTGLAVWAVRTYPEYDWYVVHVRHGLRDDEADRCAAQATAKRLNRPFLEIQAQWKAVDQANGPEDHARQARYAAFVVASKQLNTSYLALAHTADDQAETVLLRLARGTGPSGMAGMWPVSSRLGLTILRPLLHWPRSAVRNLSQGFPTVEDPTNADLEQRRAYVRHRIVPALGQARPDKQSAVPAISRLAALQAQQRMLIDHLIAPYVGPSWGEIQRISDECAPIVQKELIYRALGHDVSRALADGIERLQRGERVDIIGERWAARDRFGWIIGPKKIAWSINRSPQPELLPDCVRRGSDPLKTHPLPWKVPILKDIDIHELRVRYRLPVDSVHKGIFEYFEKSLRKQLPVVYTAAGNVVAIGPSSTLPIGHLGANVQWIAITQSHQL